jgi:uncharacterized membrane protein (UPF0127 family)
MKFIFLFWVICLGILPENYKLEKIYISVGKSTFLVEVADNEPKRKYGLMNRKSLGQDEGMLFVFPQSALQSFWMKNTLIPLDLAYFTSEGILTETFTMEPNQTEEVYNSASKVMYALELNAGTFKKNNIRKGDKLILEKRISPR